MLLRHDLFHWPAERAFAAAIHRGDFYAHRRAGRESIQVDMPVPERSDKHRRRIGSDTLRPDME